MKELGLNFDKYVGFGYDGASTMIDKQKWYYNTFENK